MSIADDAERQLVLTTRRQGSSIDSGGDGTHTVLNQADALMRRHRVFVAGADTASTMDDLPVLTKWLTMQILAASRAQDSRAHYARINGQRFLLRWKNGWNSNCPSLFNR